MASQVDAVPARTFRAPIKVAVQTKKALSKQAQKFSHHADRYVQLLNKITYCLGVLSFGSFCYLLGSRPDEIPHLYCAFLIVVLPLRWIYYRIKKWHYYLLDFCYYANAIFVTTLLFFPKNEKLFMLCFSFSEGPLAWALIVWRCSLVFSSIDKIISVIIHLLPGTVFFILRWWSPVSFGYYDNELAPNSSSWPLPSTTLWTWLFWVPLQVYVVWQALYFVVVEGFRRQQILMDPDIKTSYRELKRKAERANNIWWHLSGLLGDGKRVVMYAVIQAVFTVATLALTVPMFTSYRLHVGFEIFKLSATVWNGGKFLFDVMPRQAVGRSSKNTVKVATLDKRLKEANGSNDERYDGGINATREIDSLSYTVSQTSADVVKASSDEVAAPVIQFTVETKPTSHRVNGGKCTTCRRSCSGREHDAKASNVDAGGNLCATAPTLPTASAPPSSAAASNNNVSGAPVQRSTRRASMYAANVDAEVRGRDLNGQITCVG